MSLDRLPTLRPFREKCELSQHASFNEKSAAVGGQEGNPLLYLLAKDGSQLPGILENTDVPVMGGLTSSTLRELNEQNVDWNGGCYFRAVT